MTALLRTAADLGALALFAIMVAFWAHILPLLA